MNIQCSKLCIAEYTSKMERHKMSTLLDNDLMHQFTIAAHHKKYEYIKTYLNHKSESSKSTQSHMNYIARNSQKSTENYSIKLNMT